MPYSRTQSDMEEIEIMWNMSTSETLEWRDPLVWDPPVYGCGCCCPCDPNPNPIVPELAMEDATLRNMDTGFNDADALM